MNVSSYPEAFLTMYGWEMYYVFYLLFMSIGLFVYPFMRILNDIYVNYISGSEYAGTNYLRQLIALIVMAALVYFIAVVPLMKIELNQLKVKSMCEEKNDVANYKGKYFNNTSTRVPMMPYLAMSIGYGINNVIYTNGVCALDITEGHKATMAPDLSQAENPELLTNELNRFVSECHHVARSRLNDLRNNKYGETAAQAFKDALENTIDAMVSDTGNSDRKAHEVYLLTNYDSKLIHTLFYSDFSPLKLFSETKSLPPLTASVSVQNIAGAGNGSVQQGGETPPKCGDWWHGDSGSGPGLRARLAGALKDSVAVKMANNLGVKDCQNDMHSSEFGLNVSFMSPTQKQRCASAVERALYDGSGEGFMTEVFKNMQGGASDSLLTTGDNVKMGAAAALVGVTNIPFVSKFLSKDNIGTAVVSEITGFYMTVFILKRMLKYFIPMVLMTVYMFWGMYMIIGEFRGMTMIKGMILIIALVMMPALWAIIDHLDDKLYEALYGSVGLDVFNMALLDITTGIFQIAIVFVVFFLINEAGAGNASRAVEPSQSMGNTAATGTGRSTGAAAGAMGTKGAGQAGKWGRGVADKARNKLKPKPKYKIWPY